MTNPYQGFEYKMHIEDYLPAEEQIAPADPATLKGLMEVWRDTANQLNAEKLLTEEARSKTARAYEEYHKEIEAKLKLEDEVKKEKELKELAIQELNGFREQNKEQKEHLEKVRRHRDELADMVANTRKTLTELDEWLAKYDNGEAKTEPPEVLLMIAAMLHQSLKVADPKEQEGDVQ